MSEERSTLLDKMLGNGAAAGLRGKANDAKTKLDAAGIEHKAAKSLDEAKTKGMIDAMRAKVEAFVGQLMDSPPDGLTDGIMTIVTQSAMDTPAPAAEPAVEEAPMEDMAEDEIPVEEDDEEEEMMELDDEEEKAMTTKAVTLFDSLIETQAQIVTDLSTVTKAVTGLNQLLPLAQKVEDLTSKVAALEKQLSNRPRMATRATETEIETDDLSPDIQKHLVQKSKFWGANLAPKGVE